MILSLLTIANTLLAFQVLILIAFLVINGSYTYITFFAFRHLRESSDTAPDLDRLLALTRSANLRPITIVIPAYNEQLTLVDTVMAATQINYPHYEIVVVNDGSTDGTLERLTESFRLVPIDRPERREIETAPIRGVYVSERCPQLWVVDKENGGKADALNAGLNYSRYPLFCAIDADSILDPDALLRMGHQFLINRQLVAAGGSVRVLNGCEVEGSRVRKIRSPKSILANIQIAEYLRGFMAGRVTLGEYGSLLIISGAFGIFRKDLLFAVGGYRKTVGEDMDIVLRLHRHCVENDIKYKVYFIPEPVCWTQVPGNFPSLLRQRNRWQRALVDSIWHNRTMLFNPRYGRAGTLGMPFFLFIELFGPLIEFVGYVGFALFFVFHMLNPIFALLFFIISILWGMWLNAAAVLLDNFVIHKYESLLDSYRIALLSSLEYLGYRQVLAVERLVATFQVTQTHWGHPDRKVIQGQSTPPGHEP